MQIKYKYLTFSIVIKFEKTEDAQIAILEFLNINWKQIAYSPIGHTSAKYRGEAEIYIPNTYRRDELCYSSKCIV